MSIESLPRTVEDGTMLSAKRRQILLKTPAAILCGVVASIAAFCGPARAAQTTDSSGLEFYEKKIRPVFVQQCYKCHSTTADKLKGGLYLDSREGILKGGDTGPAVVPGHPEQESADRGRPVHQPGHADAAQDPPACGGGGGPRRLGPDGRSGAGRVGQASRPGDNPAERSSNPA